MCYQTLNILAVTPKSRGIIVLYNNKKVKIEDLPVIEEGSIISFRLKIQDYAIRILGCYAPSFGDDPDYFINCKEILDQSTEYGMIVGDLNTTLNPILDRKNYRTDNHKKSRMVINNWISENEMIDFYRLTNGNEQTWTFRVKESHVQI